MEVGKVETQKYKLITHLQEFLFYLMNVHRWWFARPLTPDYAYATRSIAGNEAKFAGEVFICLALLKTSLPI